MLRFACMQFVPTSQWQMVVNKFPNNKKFQRKYGKPKYLEPGTTYTQIVEMIMNTAWFLLVIACTECSFAEWEET